MIIGGAFYDPMTIEINVQENKMTSPPTKMSLFFNYFSSAFNQSNTFYHTFERHPSFILDEYNILVCAKKWKY